jgi:putative endonuclease
MKNNDAFVYILSNKNHTAIYVGLTSDLGKRVLQHKTGFFKNSFTSKYNVTELVYFELFHNIEDAIKREKQLKAGSRETKIKLINGFNPEWKDLMIKSMEQNL